MKFLAVFALLAIAAAHPFTQLTPSQLSEVEEIINAIYSPSTDPATAAALEQLLANFIGVPVVASPILVPDTPVPSPIVAPSPVPSPVLLPGHEIEMPSLVPTPVILPGHEIGMPSIVPSPVVLPNPVPAPVLAPGHEIVDGPIVPVLSPIIAPGHEEIVPVLSPIIAPGHEVVGPVAPVIAPVIAPVNPEPAVVDQPASSNPLVQIILNINGQQVGSSVVSPVGVVTKPVVPSPIQVAEAPVFPEAAVIPEAIIIPGIVTAPGAPIVHEPVTSAQFVDEAVSNTDYTPVEPVLVPSPVVVAPIAPSPAVILPGILN